MSEKNLNLVAYDIQALETWEAIRKRPAMYVGPIDDPKVPIQLLSEALCESRAGHARGQVKNVTISIFRKGAGVSDRIQVIDDGPGWDVSLKPNGKRKAEHLLTQLHACKEAKDPEHKGMCNAGIVVLNALCSSFEFTTWTEGRAWSQRFESGRPVTEFTDNGDCNGAHGIQIFYSLDETLLKHTMPSEADLMALVGTLRADGLSVDLHL